MFLDRVQNMRINKITKALAMTLAGVVLAGSLWTSDFFYSHAESEELDEATSCTFVIPSEFEPSSQEGVFVHKSAPYESANITYSVLVTGEEVVLTNREKEIAQEESLIEDASTELTKEIYEEEVAAAYNESYGTDVAYTVTSFDNIEVDGFPGFKIDATYNDGTKDIYQTVYMIISKYKTFTICYSRASDDYMAEVFEQSAETIHVR